HDEDFLEIGAVEDADMPAPRQDQRGAPQEVVVELELARGLEGMHLAALRVHARHYVLDHAVLAAGVEALQHDEDGPLMLGVEPVLELGEPLHPVGKQRLGLVLLDIEAAAIGGIEAVELEAAAARDAVALEDVGG